MSAWVIVAWAILLMQFTVISFDVFIGGDEPNQQQEYAVMDKKKKR